jgi:catechol 2,3-dioxygenase-like lactoylglutathione lyase family enzyme
MIRQLAHVCIHTNDLDAMVAFYSGGLGLPVQFRLRNDDDETVGVYLSCGQTTFLELFDQDLVLAMFGGDKVDLDAAPTRLQHFCFEVTGLEAMKAHLDAEQIPYLDVGMGLDDALQIWVGDPDGNAVELMEYTATSKQLVGETMDLADVRP